MIVKMDTKELVRDILERGVEIVIPSRQEMKERLESGEKLKVYFGIDPTATRIHLGHAFPLRKLQKLAELGHKVTFLIGDFTAKIGDTSDKEGERPVLSDEQIKENFAEYKKQAEKVLDFAKVEVKYNSEWLAKLGLGEVLELAGYFSVNDFISRELIRKRLSEGKRVSLPETLYPLMQGYDSYYLGTDIQLGGTDQTFNMQAGRALIRKMNDKESFILANGFLPGTDGRKMSKTWDNAIWLDDTPEEIYGKVMSIADEVMRGYWIYGTELPLDGVEEKMGRVESGENPMVVKKELAAKIVGELWGEEAIGRAEEDFEEKVVSKVGGENVPVITFKASSLPTASLPAKMVEWGVAGSNSEARRLIQQGGTYVNGERIDPDAEVVEFPNDENLFRVGPKTYVKLRK